MPGPFASADIVKEVSDHRHALRRVHDLRMELNCVDLLLRVCHRCDRTYGSMRSLRKSGRDLADVIRVAHPAGRLSRDIFEDRGLFR